MSRNTINRLPLPDKLSSEVWFTAVAGTGMGALATVLASHNVKVRGSDKAAWEPMGSMLQRAGVECVTPYAAANVPADCWLAVIGNAVSRDNPEVLEILARQIPYASFPEMVEHYIAPGRPHYVVAGTHGKTTTSSLIASLLQEIGVQPGYLLGGQPENLEFAGAWGTSPAPFVIEGDEYSSCFFDHGPKIWHYPATAAVIPSLEYDHADLYESADKYLDAFVQWDRRMAPQAHVYAHSGWPMLRAWQQQSRRPFFWLGRRRKDPIQIRSAAWDGAGWHFTLSLHGHDAGRFVFPMAGRHNLDNAALALAMLIDEGYQAEMLAAALTRFAGVRKRQSVLYEQDDHVVVFDFGHHPTEVAATIDAVRQRWPHHKLTVIFEPRSFSSRHNTHQKGYLKSFAEADRLLLAPVFAGTSIADAERLDTAAVAAAYSDAVATADFATLESLLRADDPGVYLFFSNGSFEDLPLRFANACAATSHKGRTL